MQKIKEIYLRRQDAWPGIGLRKKRFLRKLLIIVSRKSKKDIQGVLETKMTILAEQKSYKENVLSIGERERNNSHKLKRKKKR